MVALTFSTYLTWWRQQMETFSPLLAPCEGNSTVIGEFPSQRPGTRSFDVLFDLRLNIRLSKQSWGWWFEMLSRPLWRHYNELPKHCLVYNIQFQFQFKSSLLPYCCIWNTKSTKDKWKLQQNDTTCLLHVMKFELTQNTKIKSALE